MCFSNDFVIYLVNKWQNHSLNCKCSSVDYTLTHINLKPFLDLEYKKITIVSKEWPKNFEKDGQEIMTPTLMIKQNVYIYL